MCFDAATELFYYFYDYEIQSVAEAIVACRNEGDTFQLPTPADLSRAARKGTNYEIKLDLLILSNPRERDPGVFYVNYFQTKKPSIEIEVHDKELNQFWASRDLSNFQLWGAATDWTPASDPWGEDTSPRECITISGPASCTEKKRHFCRNALYIQKGGAPWASTSTSKEWDEGGSSCKTLNTTDAAYYFDVPTPLEHAGLTNENFWINQRMDATGTTQKRGIDAAFSRSAFLGQGYIASIQSDYWQYEGFNGNDRCGGPSEIAARQARFDVFGLDGATKASLLGAFDSTSCVSDSKKRPRSILTTSDYTIPVTDLKLVLDRADARKVPSSFKELKIHWFDVGQGQLQIIEPFERDGPAYIVDAGVLGPDRAAEDDDPAHGFDDPLDFSTHFREGSNMSLGKLVTAARRLIRDRPPIVLLSHPDRDHMVLLSAILGCPDPTTSGCPQDVKYIRPAKIFYGGARRSYRQDVRSIMNDVQAQQVAGAPRIYGASDTLPTGVVMQQKDGEFRATLSTITANNQTHRSSGCSLKNAASLTLEITFGDVSVYFMGDAERNAQTETAQYAAARVSGFANQRNILTASHHGAVTCESNSDDFAKAMRPEAVIYPAGASGHNHPRCGAVQHYLSYVEPTRLHDFGCLAASPLVIWDSDALFYVDPLDSNLNRHAGQDPRDLPPGRNTRDEVFLAADGQLTSLPDNRKADAQIKSVFTTQESGHIKLTIRMIKARPEDPPEPDGYYFFKAKSGSHVRRVRRRIDVPTLHKRFAGLEPTQPQITEILQQLDGSYVGLDAAANIYAWVDQENSQLAKAGWIGPLVLSGHGHYTTPGANGDPMHISHTIPDSPLLKFKHMGQFFSNDAFISDDAGSSQQGDLVHCANKCLRTADCGRFTYAYRYFGSRGQYCTLFRKNASPSKTTSDYQMYERLQ